MRTSGILFKMFFIALCFQSSAQDCIVISDRPVHACLSNITLRESALKTLKDAPEGALESLFFLYFAGTDYNGYRELFLTTDWYGLSLQKFSEWRSYVQGADMRMLGFAEIRVGETELGIVKYTYAVDDLQMYEIFLAKKAGTQWRPASVEEERDYFFYSSFIKYTRLDYLQSLGTEIARNPDVTLPGVSSNNRILAAKMLIAKDSIQAYDTETFNARFNPEFKYRTPAKYQEDRTHDAEFVSYLNEMQLEPAEIDIVMKYIVVHDYLHAAQKADDFSDISYTYAPFVDKIREIYGHDRIRKWDSVNKKWN